MIDKNEVINTLRRGVTKVYSRFSPVARQEDCKKFHQSSHPSREFLFVISGESYYMYNNSVYRCSPGTLFLIDSGMSHGHRYTHEDNNLLHIWGYFHERQVHLSAIEITLNGHCQAVSGMSQILIPEGLHNQIEKRWNLLSQLKNAAEHDVENYIKTPVNAMLDEMAFQLSEKIDTMMEYTKMGDLQRYIRSRNGRQCSLAHLAAISGYTRGYLAHKFHDEVGMTIGQYIDKVRLEYINLAKKRGIRQKEIAYELGFSSPAAFWNWYQKYRDKQ